MSDLRKALLADHAFRYDIGAEQRADRAATPSTPEAAP